MIISRTPLRISFFGGGTDYPVWIRENGGAVLATTFDKYCYISCRYLPPFFPYRSRVVYSKVELIKSNAKIEHPAVRGILKYLKITGGVEIHHDADLPARTGLGSSSAFVVGLLHALHALRREMPDRMALAREAIRVEQEVLKENVGCQDQVVASLGGLNRIDFREDGAIQATPIIISRERRNEFHGHFMLYFTGFSRFASQIVAEQLARMQDKTRELRRMYEMVSEGVEILTGKTSLSAFGRLMDEGWRLKRGLSSKVSTPTIDDMYRTARKAGALGGKLLGAGGGGFMLLFVEPGRQAHVAESLKSLLRVPFRFENEGSRIILYQPDESA